MVLSVLIVDDSRVSRQIVRRALPPWDLEVREASGGAECLASYHEKKADIVLLDLTMPGMDGFQALQRLPGVVQVAERLAHRRVTLLGRDVLGGIQFRYVV